MRQHLVYDLPTRLFHWLFAGLFLTAFSIGKLADDESPLFSYHMLAGLTLGFVLLLRLIWGILGTQHARFSGFALKPQDFIQYFKGLLSGSKKRWAGHNPASSWAAILMMLLTAGLGITGFLMTSGGNKETFEDLHELLGNAFIVTVILHIGGIILHTMRHKEMIGLSMLDGKKENIMSQDQIQKSHPFISVLLIGLVTVFSLHLLKNYDSQNKTLQFFGTSLQLGENESAENETAEVESEEE